jgi:hypothetical protein
MPKRVFANDPQIDAWRSMLEKAQHQYQEKPTRENLRAFRKVLSAFAALLTRSDGRREDGFLSSAAMSDIHS